MVDMTFQDVVKLVDRLTPEEQIALAEHLKAHTSKPSLTLAQKHAMLESLKFNVGEWPEDFSFRREDWYGDDE